LSEKVTNRARRAGRRTVRNKHELPRAVGLALLAPVTFLLAILFVWPFLSLFWTSVSDPTLGLQNFTSFFNTPSYVRATLTTFRVTLVVATFALALGVMIAWKLRTSRSTLMRLLLWSALILPLWQSVVIRNYAFTILLERTGVVNTTLNATGVINQPMDLLYTEFAVTIGMLYSLLPYAILPVYASFQAIDMELLSAARSAGASKARAFVSIVVPLSLPSLLASFAIVFILGLGFYITPVVLGGAGSPFLATVIDQQIYGLFDLPLAAATSTLLFIEAVIILIVAVKTVGFDRIRRAVA